ncbi:hypothetical protein BD311DRAFT_37621 [Dichomitus squalens]|uniref:Uncharacterized protein n=1 Tax=Dichomitus squalens TaxID=114155 RepID=A0A4Q9MC69_9APHY|nr:hypothetical protein BD311DRAFT_37621 [Dichomitus squalens]
MIDALAGVYLAASACFLFYCSTHRCISVPPSLDLRLVSYIIPFSSVSLVYPLSLGLLHRPFYHVPIPLTLCIYNAFLDVATLLVHCWHTWRTLLFRFAVCFQSFRDDHAIKCI